MGDSKLVDWFLVPAQASLKLMLPLPFSLYLLACVPCQWRDAVYLSALTVSFVIFCWKFFFELLSCLDRCPFKWRKVAVFWNGLHDLDMDNSQTLKPLFQAW